MTTFARACPVSLSRKPLSPGIKATPKTDLSLSRSLVHRQTRRLTGLCVYLDLIILVFVLRISELRATRQPIRTKAFNQTTALLLDYAGTFCGRRKRLPERYEFGDIYW